MQANCPQCQQKIVIDDARVPDRAFSVKCPKCQNTVKFPGRAPAGGPGAPGEAAAGAPPAEGVPSEAASAPSAAPPPPADDVMRSQLMAQLRREMTLPAAEAGSAGRALLSLPDRALAGAVTVMLNRQGYAVDTIEDTDEASRLVEQGIYNIVVGSRAAVAQGKESLPQRVARLSPENRRRIFMILLGEEWKSGDTVQAFAACVDLVLNSRDAANADALLRNTVQERTRLYQVYLDARQRHEASANA